MILSVVIPVHNEATNILKVVEELEVYIKKDTRITEYEFIICDDHSTDGTFDILKNSAVKNLKIIRLSRRNGSHISVRAGLNQSKGDLVLCIAGDGQDDPAILSDMITKAINGDHIIWGVRKQRKQGFFEKIFAKIFYSLLYKLLGGKISDIDLSNADFYMLERSVVDSINSCTERNTSLFGLIVWLGYNQSAVEYNRRERISGKSKWGFRSKFGLARDWIIAFSGIPLKMITYLGIIYATLGFLYAIFIFIYTILGYTTPGWSESFLILLIGDGVKMIMLGIIGEYLWRTLDETRKRPLYFIEKKLDR